MAPKRIPQHRPTHAKLHVAKAEAARLSAHARGYDRTWQNLRLMILRRSPLCVRCGTGASQVDHIVPIRKGGARLDPDNLQALCHSCHSQKTASEDR